MQIPTLETPRRILRAPRESDFVHESALHASDALRFVGGPMPDRIADDRAEVGA